MISIPSVVRQRIDQSQWSVCARLEKSLVTTCIVFPREGLGVGCTHHAPQSLRVKVTPGGRFPGSCSYACRRATELKGCVKAKPFGLLKDVTARRFSSSLEPQCMPEPRANTRSRVARISLFLILFPTRHALRSFVVKSTLIKRSTSVVAISLY